MRWIDTKVSYVLYFDSLQENDKIPTYAESLQIACIQQEKAVRDSVVDWLARTRADFHRPA